MPLQPPIERPTLERVTLERRELVLDLLAEAFREYPVMRFIARDAGAAYEEHLRAIVGFYCDLRLVRGFPVLVLFAGDEPAAALLANEPSPGPWPVELHERQRRLQQRIGGAATERMLAFEAECDRSEPAFPHYYVGMLGVRPAFQGRGYGRLLLERVAEMSAANPLSQAVCLTTEDAANVPFYRHLGFRVIHEADVGDLHTWCLVRETP